MSGWTLGIIGGSGLYQLDGLEDIRTERVFTPWGEPSAPLVKVRLNGIDLVFLSRHDAGHRIPPGDINYRANIDAMKRAGVTDLLSLSACGSLREELAPGAFVAARCGQVFAPTSKTAKNTCCAFRRFAMIL